jgi:hypothetical protein
MGPPFLFDCSSIGGYMIVNGGRVMARTNDQMPDFGKSINVFNNDPRVKNPFLRNGRGNSQPAGAGERPEPSNKPQVPQSNSSCEE